jgi:hypothetical protein
LDIDPVALLTIGTKAAKLMRDIFSGLDDVTG